MINYFEDKNLTVFTNLDLWPYSKKYFDFGHHYLLLYCAFMECDPDKLSDVLIRFDVDGKSGTVPMTISDVRDSTIIGLCDLGTFSSRDASLSVYSYLYDGVLQTQAASAQLKPISQIGTSLKLTEYCGSAWPVFVENYYLCTCGQINGIHADHCLFCGRSKKSCLDIADDDFTQYYIDRYTSLYGNLQFDARLSYKENLSNFCVDVISRMPFLKEQDIMDRLPAKYPEQQYEDVISAAKKNNKKANDRKIKIGVLFAVIAAIIVGFVVVFPIVVLFPKAETLSSEKKYSEADAIYSKYYYLLNKAQYHDFLIKAFSYYDTRNVRYYDMVSNVGGKHILSSCEYGYWHIKSAIAENLYISSTDIDELDGCEGFQYSTVAQAGINYRAAQGY